MPPTRSSSTTTGITLMVAKMRAVGRKPAAPLANNTAPAIKRKADTKLEENGTKKRSAFGDLTNAIGATTGVGAKGKSLKNEKPTTGHVTLKAATKDAVAVAVSEDKVLLPEQTKEPLKALPKGVEDFDKDCGSDPFQLGQYASNIFTYFKERELKFLVPAYLDKQKDITREMRAVLVDWLVEVQEMFELTHESLYIAVKLVDIYLSQKVTSKDNLQLIGATAMFISCKFEERFPPYIDDFLYICDNAYSRQELIRTEIDILKTVNFDIGFPLSYSFLRRYARVSKTSMETLTLARYILEMSLMDYDMVRETDSKVAAAALLLAFQIQNLGKWTPTLEHYSGYSGNDLVTTATSLLAMLKKKQNKNIKTIQSKYSHQVFHEVAKLPLPDKLDL